MTTLPGVFLATKKDGTIYFRASITYKNKHISLGSFNTEDMANYVYLCATEILRENRYHLEDYKPALGLSFEKWVILHNFRDNNLYCKTPIYLKNRFFYYYLNRSLYFKFDIDDLFYYAHHKIIKRGGHLFVNDYGMQVNILSRYGIKNYGVKGRDYEFMNGDSTDYRYENIRIINLYHGVTKSLLKGTPIYTAKIHINGDYIIGRYATETEAAIAYNKAADIIKNKGFQKEFPENYINDLNEIEYASIYHRVRMNKKIREFMIP